MFWAFSSLVIQMFKRMRSVTWVVFVIYAYREKSHTRGAELVDWQAALKHPCWARFMCFIPTRWILIEFFLTTTQLPQTFSFLLFIFSCQHPLQYTSISSRHCWRAELTKCQYLHWMWDHRILIPRHKTCLLPYLYARPLLSKPHKACELLNLDSTQPPVTMSLFSMTV